MICDSSNIVLCGVLKKFSHSQKYHWVIMRCWICICASSVYATDFICSFRNFVSELEMYSHCDKVDIGIYTTNSGKKRERKKAHTHRMYIKRIDRRGEERKKSARHKNNRIHLWMYRYMDVCMQFIALIRSMRCLRCCCCCSKRFRLSIYISMLKFEQCTSSSYAMNRLFALLFPVNIFRLHSVKLSPLCSPFALFVSAGSPPGACVPVLYAFVH